MFTSSIDTDFITAIESAKKLADKDRIKLIKQLFPDFSLNRLKYLSQLLEEAISDAIDREDEIANKRATFLYKKVHNNTYVSLRFWGIEECNIYLGPMPFLPGVKYKLTNLVSGETKTLLGHKLFRNEEQVYMKVEQLTPVHQVLSYLYYDHESEFPRRPQDVCIKQVFSKKKWRIEKIEDDLEITNSNREDFKEEVVTEISSFKKAPSLLEETAIPIAKTTSNLPVNLAHKNQKIPKKRVALITILVEKTFEKQVQTLLTQWVDLSQFLQPKYRWNLIANGTSHCIFDSENRLLVEYSTTARTIATKSPHTLLNLLKQNLQAIIQNSLVTQEQQALVNRYLLRFNEAPQNDYNKLLAYLFSL